MPLLDGWLIYYLLINSPYAFCLVTSMVTFQVNFEPIPLFTGGQA